jgi:predicted CoA-binding protein
MVNWFIKMPNSQHHVAVLGASPKPARYANQAVRMLLEHNYQVTPIHPKFSTIENLPVAASLTDVKTPVDTLTLYVGPERLVPQIDDIIALKPKRVIFNPGTESSDLQQALDKAGIEWFEACTLVMLRTNQF